MADRPITDVLYERLRTQPAEELDIEPGPEVQAHEANVFAPHTSVAGPSGNPAAAAHPKGTMTFLLTDVEGSTPLWAAEPERMSEALPRHERLVHDAAREHGGHVFKSTGDGLFAAFPTALDAVLAAVAAQRALVAEPWQLARLLKVRIGLHSGEAEFRGGDYFGLTVSRTARLADAGHGGQIVVSHATAMLVRDALPPEVQLVDLGKHRLRDFARPESIFQIHAPGLPQRFPPLRSLAAAPGNLPVQVTSFIGRDEEIAGISDALSHAALVTITGVGGVGKTRLAIEAAGRHRAWRDGAWFCDLAPAADRAAIEQAVASVLGLPTSAGVPLATNITEFLRDKHLLLILDNCEQVIGEIAELVSAWLRTCAHLRVLATSREPLAVAGELIRPLRPLPIPETSADAERAREIAAVRLFEERAAAVRPGFALEAGNLGAVLEICRRLDGIPLAIELAAARTVAMGVTEIASHLDERFRLLGAGRRASVARHQTLRATVDWSYRLLPERDKRVFERLSVFAGSFDTDAAISIVGEDDSDRFDVIDALTSLATRSMITVDETPAGTVRYRLIETLRQYGQERLDERGEIETWRGRHAEHFAALAEEIGRGVLGPDEVTWLARVRGGLDNLRAALNWSVCMEGVEPARLAVRIVAGLATIAGTEQIPGVSNWLDTAADRIDVASPAQRTQILSASAWRAFYRGDVETARRLAEAALAGGVARETLFPGSAHHLLGLAAFASGDIAAALAHVEEGQRTVHALGGDKYSRVLLNGSAIAVLSNAGHLMEARTAVEEALVLARELRNPTALASALYLFGVVSWRLGEDAAALDALEECVELCRSSGAFNVGTRALALGALLRARQGDPPSGGRALLEGLQIASESGDRNAVLTVLHRGVEIFVRADEPEAAAVVGGAVGVGAQEVVLFHTRDEDLEAALRRAKAELGDHAYEGALARGRGMAYEEIVEYTRGRLGGLGKRLDAPPDPVA